MNIGSSHNLYSFELNSTYVSFHPRYLTFIENIMYYKKEPLIENMKLVLKKLKVKIIKLEYLVNE